MHRGALAEDVGEAEGGRRLVHIGEHLAEEGAGFLRVRGLPRLRDEGPERHRLGQRVRRAVEAGDDLLAHQLVGGVILEQVVMQPEHQPAPACGIAGEEETG